MDSVALPKFTELNLPIGDLVDTRPAMAPELQNFQGRHVTLEPLSLAKHGDSIYTETHGTEAQRFWRYLPYGPFENRHDFDELVEKYSASKDPLFFAVVDNVTGRALGWQTLMRADLPNRVIEVGHVVYGASLQRSRGATEAQYLFARYVFDVLGYRRYEWKCDNLNGPSKRAALRLGFTADGVFPQHMIIKGRTRDTAWFSMLDRDWPVHRTAFEAWLHSDNFDEHGNQIKPLGAFK